MDKVDLKKSKEIISGKQPSRDDYKNRSAVLYKPLVKQGLDLAEAKGRAKELREQAKESYVEKMERERLRFENLQKHPRVRGADPNDPFAKTRMLFAFKNKFHSVTDGVYKKLDLTEAETFITQGEVKTYYLCISDNACPVPPLMIGKNASGITCKDENAVVDYINRTGGVTITIKDL
jgi:hypothetical protein